MITKPMLKAFREDFKTEMKTLEDKYGVTVSIGNITFDTNSFHTQMKVIAGSSEEAEKIEFEKYASSFMYYGINKEMYNQEFKASDGNTYKLVGLKPKARKNICVILSNNGKRYVCDTKFLGIERN